MNETYPIVARFVPLVRTESLGIPSIILLLFRCHAIEGKVCDVEYAVGLGGKC